MFVFIYFVQVKDFLGLMVLFFALLVMGAFSGMFKVPCLCEVPELL